MAKTRSCRVCVVLTDDQLAAIAPLKPRATATLAAVQALAGPDITGNAVRFHFEHVLAGTVRFDAASEPQAGVLGDVCDNQDRFVENADEAQAAWFREHGIDMPPGFVGGTIKTGDHYLRVKPIEDAQETEIRQASPVDLRIHIAAALPSRRPSNLHAGFLYGDAQIGWVLDDDEQWIPTHDPAAIDVSLQVLADMQAEHNLDTVTNLGDHLDLPALSKHRSSPSAVAFGSLNKAIQSAYEFDAAVAALTPNARRVLVSGNHDERFTLHLIDTSPHLVGLRRAGEDTTPVISVPFLLRHDETGFEMTQAYPNGEEWLSPGIRAVHGPCVRPTNNQTSDKYLSERPDCSTFYGHTHRPGFTQKTFETFHGPVIRVAGSPGCLARVDGVLPSARGGHTPTGRPTRLTEKWGQGVALVFYDPEDPTFTPVVEHVQIRDGVAHWRGREYRARVDVNGREL